MRSFARMRAACGVPIVYDATHSVQQPGQGTDGASGGLREFIPPLLYAAAAAGADGFFLETHPDPDSAPSDGPNMVPLDQLTEMVRVALNVWHAARAAGTAGSARVAGAAGARSQVGGGVTVEDRATAAPATRK
jgi:2-dehydro-3-deoxyphosphooctonate aldolase (KDO 8-P synthase)